MSGAVLAASIKFRSVSSPTTSADVFAKSRGVLFGGSEFSGAQHDLADEPVREQCFDVRARGAVAGCIFDDEIGHGGDFLRIGVTETTLFNFRHEVGQIGQAEADTRVLLAGRR